MEAAVFFVAATLALGGALGVVVLRSPFYNVLALVIHLVALATLFLLLNAAFLAAAQVVVYAGAVMVLYVFVVAYVGQQEEPISERGRWGGVLAPCFALALLFELSIAIVGSGLKALDEQGPHVAASFGSPAQVGELFLTRFLLAFEIASFLLLVGAIGAVLLARRRRGLDSEGVGPVTAP